MKANNTLNVSDLARWIDLQLSTIIEGVSAGYTLGNYNSVWIDKGATVFNVSLANGETVEIDSDNYNTAEEIATAIISTLNNTHLKQNTVNTVNNTAVNMEANEVCAILTKYKLNGDDKFRYMMLSRMQADCNYYLGNGGQNAKHSLWACDESEHIEIMRALWHSLPVAPEWLTLEEIDEYAKRMNV